MRRRIVAIVSALFMVPMLLVPVFAAGESLLVGTWTLDLSKFVMPSPPRSVTISFTDVGGGKYGMTMGIVDHDGTTRHGKSTFKPDGAPCAALGNADYDVVSMTMPSRRILVMGGAFKGHPANTRVFSLPAGSKQMIETVVWHALDGTPHTRVDYWNRAK